MNSLLSKSALTLCCIIIFSFTIIAQTPGLENQKEFQLHIKKITAEITINGELNEPVWQTAEVAGNLLNWVPQDVGRAKRKVEMRTCYNEHFIFFSFIGYDSNNQVIKTLKRDAAIGESDCIGLTIDPNNEHLSGYEFILNVANVQAEAVIPAGGNIELDWSWDNNWTTAVKQYPDKWTMEIAIPFKTLRYDKNNTEWGINFGQADINNNAYSVWAKLPADKKFTDLGFTGKLIWDAPPPAVHSNVAFIPYAKTAFSTNKEHNKSISTKPAIGFDAKIGLSSALNLDLTVNPDFSQVEVDKQVTNLTRFNIFFPEKRTFFLENADLFSEYGSTEIRPFYSRAIGLDKSGNAIPIIAGVRLTGNIGNKTRIGIMNMETLKQQDFAAQNYTAIAFNERIFARSVLKGYFLNRQAFMDADQREKFPLDIFSRNAGLQIDLSDKRSLFRGWAGYHASFKKDISANNRYYQAGGGYFGRKVTSSLSFDNVGTNYYADMGFVQRITNYDAAKDSLYRLGFKQLTNPNKYTIYPAKGKINRHIIALNNSFVWNPNGSFNERKNELLYTINFKSTASIIVGGTSQQSNLLYAVKFVADSNALPLPAAAYFFKQGNFKFNTDTRKLFYVAAGFQAGGFYKGRMLQQTASFNLRKQPWGNFSLDFEYNQLRFPGRYGSANLYLIGSKVEIGFSPKVFWTTFLQYNTQQNNFNVNSRFQWRFKPMSDIYIVYTDNYFTDPFFKNKNRGLILKMNWWLNL